jgi:hypothetical protein
LLSITELFFIQLLIIHDIISSQTVDKRIHVGFWTMDELIHYS